MQNIKELFPEFFQAPLNKKDLNKSSQNIIILDTNYLLEIIKSPVKISDTYIKALEKVQDNIYIPYLVALEFNFNGKLQVQVSHPDKPVSACCN